MQNYADIIFPTAVRQSFTYQIPSSLQTNIKVGVRVWVPFQKHTAIGLVVHLHEREPDFTTRSIKKVLDDKPILSEELLRLTHWVHRFYYCGWGEVVQAALPAGLNFQTEKFLNVSEKYEKSKEQYTKNEQDILDAIYNTDEYPFKEAKKRWAEYPHKQILERLIDQDILEVWEQPVRKIAPKTEKHWFWSPDWPQNRRSDFLETSNEEGKDYKWIRALELLAELDLPRSQTYLGQYELLDYYSLNRIAEEGIIQVKEMPVTGFDLDLPHEPEAIKSLNDEQEAAFQQISKSMEEKKYESFLLYGVTGSGKTEVYIHALKKALEMGRGGLILVPEISLTPQTVRRFYQIFGDDIAVLHSQLSMRERYQAWKALQDGEKRIAIGARSAVFAPVQNLGLLVVDEEHESSYKQEDPAPRYHAREVAIMRAYQTDSVVILGSATPSMVSLHAAQKGKSNMLVLSERHKGASLPEVHVLDLKQYQSAMKGPLAVPLHDAIKKALQAGEQVILLHNRRGFSSYLQCESCGHMPECPNCSVSMTYHKKKELLRCHYCGYAANIPSNCSQCSSTDLKKKGMGTQQIEEEIRTLFPEAAIQRMDRDSTAARNSHEAILDRFDRGEVDILLGTQLVAKGLDFPNVTVVGVINADTELAFPSYRAGERMYQLLSQVAGRSGRSEKAGQVFLQTWQSEHYAVQCAQRHDHRLFARHEMNQRKLLHYPPYTRLISFQFKAREEQRASHIAEVFTNCLREISGSRAVLGPSPSTITRMQGWTRWECLVKVEKEAGAKTIENLLNRAFKSYETVKPRGATSVRINVNVDALE